MSASTTPHPKVEEQNNEPLGEGAKRDTEKKVREDAAETQGKDGEVERHVQKGESCRPKWWMSVARPCRLGRYVERGCSVR